MSLADYCRLVLLAAIWGASYLFIRIASPVFGPITLMDARVLLAAAVMLVALRLLHRRAELRPIWRPLMLLGAINAALPFTLIAIAELRLPASLASILNTTTPLFTAAVAALWIGERLTGRRVVGLLIGFCGVVLVVGWGSVGLNVATVLSAACSLLAALCYGIGNVYTRVRFTGIPAATLTAGQQLFAGVVLLPFVTSSHPVSPISLRAALALLALSVICTSLAYLLYFSLVESAGPTRASLYAFLIPIFGVLWGALFLGERVPLGMLAGLALVLVSVALVNGLPVRTRPTNAQPPLSAVQE